MGIVRGEIRGRVGRLYGIYFVVVLVIVDYSVLVYNQNEILPIVLHTSPLFLGWIKQFVQHLGQC